MWSLGHSMVYALSYPCYNYHKNDFFGINNGWILCIIIGRNQLFIFRNNEMKRIVFGDIKVFNLYICKMLEVSRPYSGNVP
jgi:hypothetical protein